MFSGKKLKKRRKELGYSQTQIANALNINRTSYHQWEAEKTKPNQKNLKRLAHYLQVDNEYFESEYTIVSSYLQLNSTNQQKLEDYADTLLESQNNTAQLFPIQVLDDIRLSAGSGEMVGDEYTTSEVLADQDYSYEIASFSLLMLS